MFDAKKTLVFVLCVSAAICLVIGFVTTAWKKIRECEPGYVGVKKIVGCGIAAVCLGTVGIIAQNANFSCE